MVNGGDDYYRASLGSGGGSVAYLPIADSAGTVYTFPATDLDHVNTNQQNESSLPYSIEDRNGNQVVVTDLDRGGNGVLGSFTATDPLGRTLLSSSGFGVSGNTLAVSGLSTPYSITWGSSSLNFSVSTWLLHNASGNCDAFPSDTGTENVVMKITLPNGQFYQFTYDPAYGTVNQITYPTGGYVQYTWGVNGRSEAAVLTDTNGNTNSCYYEYDVPAVTHRYVSFDGTHVALTQDFTYSTTWSSDVRYWSTKTTTVKATDNITGAVSYTDYTYTPVNAPVQPDDFFQGSAFQIPVEQTIVNDDSTGTPMRTVNKTWWDQYELKSEQTVLENGLTNQTTYTYGSGAQVTDKKEYDWGNGTPGSYGALLRDTVTNYHSFVATPIYPAGPSIFDKPSQVIVYDGSSNRMAETDYAYDQTALAAVSGMPTGTHDETNYPSAFTGPRGNLTTKTQQCFPLPPATQTCSNPVATYSYDETGQALTMLDPNGNTTTYSYADNYQSGTGTPTGNTNAYVTKVTHPATNGVSHIDNYTYGYSDGQLRVAQDQNGQNTSYIYNDGMGRLTETDFPDGGKTTNAYNDTAPAPSVTHTTLVTTSPSLSLSTTTVMDGVIHPTQAQLTTDPENTDYSDTTYDGLGHTWKKSNPHRSGSLPTDGTAVYAYDALNRTISVTQPDNSVAQTSYSGNCTTVTDEAGKNRKSCTDGLGRLTGVWEDPSVANYQTVYQYNALGNMLCVEQHGNATSTGCSSPPSSDATSAWRVRRFYYDSLGQILTTSNPETGQISYSYDSNGNTLTKVAPRPNQQAPSTLTETITNTYDALNRLTQTSYTGVATPTATYAYDGVAPTGCTPAPPSLTDSYPKGRRTAMCDGSGATSWSHDKMGRVLTETRTIVGTSNVTKSVVYTYNLDGSVATVQYPGTNKIITYQPGGAGRPLSAKDVAGGINYATGATYAPAGALMTMVNGGTVTVTNSYNSRVQPVVLSAATIGQTVLSLSYDFHTGNGDNGNIYQIANNRDTTRTENFTYDNLNRLTQASSSGTKWGEAFTADPWGNMWQRSLVSGKTNYEPLNAPASLQNQLTGFTYDVAGNMIQNGSATYTYDGDNRITATAGWTYIYDGDGVRVVKKNGTTGTLYWTGTGSEAISESDLAGTDKEEYVFFGAERVARRDVATNAVHYYFSDHLGSASIVTNASGAIEDESDYYPYGGEMVISATAPQNYKFTGKERDAESGLDDFGARFHASALGRFMTPDWDAKPVTVPYAKFGDPQTLNLYSYVENDPVNRADADGHQWHLSGVCDSGGCASAKELGDLKKKAQNKTTPSVDQKAFKESLRGYHPGGGKETVATIAGRINHETRGMKDSKKESEPLSDAREQIAHVRINGIAEWGNRVQAHASLASPEMSGPDFAPSLEAATNAVLQNGAGTDPTNGALFFKMTTSMKDTSDFQGESQQTQAGPYISPTKYTVIDTYGPNQ